MTSLLSPGNYIMELRTIAEPKIKNPKSALLCHSFAIPGQLSTQPAWLYFSNLDTLNAYMLAAPGLIGKSFAVEVNIKTEKVGNREYSWNTLRPKWGLGIMSAPTADASGPLLVWSEQGDAR